MSNNRLIYAIVLLSLGSIVVLVGALMKISHTTLGVNPDVVLGIGLVLELIGMLFIGISIYNRKKKELS